MSAADRLSYEQHFWYLDLPTRNKESNHSELRTLKDFCFIQALWFVMHENLYTSPCSL